MPTAERIDRSPGADHTDGFETVAHRMPMLSLEKLTPNRRDADGQPVPYEVQLDAWYARRLKDLELAPSTSPSFCAIKRPMASVPAPGANGTTILTGFSG